MNLEEETVERHLDRYALLFNYEFKLRHVALFQACFDAENYRRFNVGAAVLASNGHNFRIFGGANIMNGKGRPKVCAEQQAIKKAFLAGYPEILIIYVVGKPQPDKQSGITSPTLHPCWDCRILAENMYKLSAETLIYTVSFEEDGPTELFTLPAIIEYHNQVRGL